MPKSKKKAARKTRRKAARSSSARSKKTAKGKTSKSRGKKSRRRRPASRIKKKVENKIQEGAEAPDFTVKNDFGENLTLSHLRGKQVVLYFYPKDDTPGCTRQACALRDGISKIQDRGAVVLGVSADSVESHQKFKTKYSLNFPLLSDENKEIVQKYGVWKEKSMYGRTFMGIERTTFLIDEQGRIKKIFPKVNVETHYEDVLNAL